MKALNEEEIEEVISIAYEAAQKTILSQMNKKEFEDIEININLESLDDGFDLSIEINLDSDFEIPEDLSKKAIDNSLNEVDKYIEERNNKLNE